MVLIYPQEVAIEILNVSSSVLYKPKWGFAIWDLDRVDSSGKPTILPLRTQEGDWIRGHEGLGPEAAMSEVSGMTKPGDRLVGYVTVTCPDCVKARAYWIYATAHQGGWFSEAKNGYPDLASIAKSMKSIRDNPEILFGDIQQVDRIPIYETLRDIPRPPS